MQSQQCPISNVCDELNCPLVSEELKIKILTPLQKIGLENITVKMVQEIPCEQLRDEFAELLLETDMITSDDYYAITTYGYELVMPDNAPAGTMFYVKIQLPKRKEV